jgi:hypothetical protein
VLWSGKIIYEAVCPSRADQKEPEPRIQQHSNRTHKVGKLTSHGTNIRTLSCQRESGAAARLQQNSFVQVTVNDPDHVLRDSNGIVDRTSQTEAVFEFTDLGATIAAAAMRMALARSTMTAAIIANKRRTW